jgi:molybdopterin-guanine dinucleotide biosynthesis protein A
LQSGNYKIVPLFPKDRTLRITEAEMARFAFSAEMFENLNTPADLERAQRRLADKKA